MNMNWLDLAILALLAAGLVRGLATGLAGALLRLGGMVLGWVVAYLYTTPAIQWLEERYRVVTTVEGWLGGISPFKEAIQAGSVPVMAGGETADPSGWSQLPLPEVLQQFLRQVSPGTTAPAFPQAWPGVMLRLLATWAVGVLVFIFLFFLVRLLTGLLASLLQGTLRAVPTLSLANRLAGAVFGLAEAGLVVTLVLGLLLMASSLENLHWFADGVEGSTLAPLFLSIFQSLLPVMDAALHSTVDALKEGLDG